MIYLTFGDSPGGVLYSQVVDVCNYLTYEFKAKIKMVFFISVRGFFAERKKYKAVAPDCIVLPMFPKLATWKWNSVTLALLCLLTGQRSIMARGVLASNLALALRKAGVVRKVCYDGRGAYNAEWHEYQISPNEKLKNQIHRLESKAVNKSDFRLAVSHQLILYWQNEFGYKQYNHVVIPCLLNSATQKLSTNEKQIMESRMQQNYHSEDVLFVYSGSTAGWQSFKLLEDWFTPLLSNNTNFKVLFLSGKTENLENLKSKFPKQVNYNWVAHEKVQQTLLAFDYGILLRENSVTNSVASPTKFAEYLAAGLQVIISEKLGDYSEFVIQNKCGVVFNRETLNPHFEKTALAQRQNNMLLVENNFTKESRKAEYQKIMEALN